MEDTMESLLEYYRNSQKEIPEDLRIPLRNAKHFNVIKRENCTTGIPFCRKDYYKMSLTVGKSILYTEQGQIEIDRPAIFFSNPSIRFGWENISDDQSGYVCLFNEAFLSADLRHELNMLYAAFEKNVYPFLFLDDTTFGHYQHYFQLMFSEYQGHFKYKNELIRNTLKLIIYHSLKIQSLQQDRHQSSEHNSLVSRFMEVLNAQFPIDSPKDMIAMRSPKDFADHLHIHVNHLNHTVKHYFGKSTTQIIHTRLLEEAENLLLHSNWNIAEIGYALGFDYPQHFNQFFKKMKDLSPRQFKTQAGRQAESTKF